MGTCSCTQRTKSPNQDVITIDKVGTMAFADQKPGTSGLRKKTARFENQKGYLQNFVQAIFDSQDGKLAGETLVLGGDGRYFNEEAAMIILRIAAANGVAKMIVSPKFLMSTPCVSGLIRKYKCAGGIILTASHNPGGKQGDFGVKYNVANGGPATSDVTEKIFAITKEIKEYQIAREVPRISLATPGTARFGDMTIQVIDAVGEYADLMKSIFDFGSLKTFVSRSDFSMVYDSMSGVAGPFAKRIFAEELGLPEGETCLNGTPLPDFGGGHPDPNLKYAEELVKRMGLNQEASRDEKAGSIDDSKIPDFGAAADGDADRNMVVGRRFFVTPSDSLAVIVDRAQAAIPYFKDGVKGAARSMPTSGAVDIVAREKKIDLFEVPTGWKYFGNLMEAGKVSICGEESFGTGSDHIREKDGIWAVLAWLSILAKANEGGEEGKLIGVGDIMKQHWKKYGRNYYTRYDYEGYTKQQGNDVFGNLRDKIEKKNFEAFKYTDYKVAEANEFEYKDPIDGSVAKRQGIRVMMEGGSRIIFRLSGTGSVGATVRMYIEQYSKSAIDQNPAEALKPLVDAAIKWANLAELLGTETPTVIT